MRQKGRRPRTKGLVLGLGNDILSDDGVGLVVVRRLRKLFEGTPSIEFVETNEMGLSLLDFIAGYDWVVVVDSIITGEHEPGTVRVFDGWKLDDPRAGNPHHMGLDEVLAMGEKADLKMPKKLYVVAIEVKDPFSFGEALTPSVERAVPEAVGRVEKLINEKCLGAE